MGDDTAKSIAWVSASQEKEISTSAIQRKWTAKISAKCPVEDRKNNKIRNKPLGLLIKSKAALVTA